MITRRCTYLEDTPIDGTGAGIGNLPETLTLANAGTRAEVIPALRLVEACPLAERNCPETLTLAKPGPCGGDTLLYVEACSPEVKDLACVRGTLLGYSLVRMKVGDLPVDLWPFLLTLMGWI